MTNRNELAAMLIRFYNAQAGTALRANNETNQGVILAGLDKMGGDIPKLKAFIREWTGNHPEARTQAYCLHNCINAIPEAAPQALAPQAPAPQPAPVSDAQVGYSMGILEQAVVQLISKANVERIEQETAKTIAQQVREFMMAEYGPVTRKVNTVINGVAKPLQGVQHKKFETVLKFVANDEPVYLVGPAGSGKNVLCKQVADALGLKFYFTNAVTQEYQLKGFTDAMGNYQPTQFYKAFTEGGVFMLDEMDASIPETLVILNAAIANRYFDFPAPIGYKEAHPDFRVVAAGNTLGHGADFEYVGRNQLDGASLDRFAPIRIDYDETIENSLAGDIELANFCREYRSSADKAGIKIIVSYRAIGRLAKMLNLLSVEEALETCLVKGIAKDDLNIIIRGISTENKYTSALKHVMKNLHE